MSDIWRKSLLPVGALARLLALLRSYVANSNNSSPSQIHNVCGAMMSLSTAFGHHAKEIYLAHEVTEALRDLNSTSALHFLLVCSAVSKLLVSFCMREPLLGQLPCLRQVDNLRLSTLRRQITASLTNCRQPPTRHHSQPIPACATNGA